MVKDIDLQDLADSKQLRQIIGSLKNGKDHYVIKENGQPQAALLSLDDLELLEQAMAGKEKIWQDLFANLEDVHAKNPNVSEDAVHADVAEAIKAVRSKQN